MKKGHKRLLIFELSLLFIILLNSFISNILVKYNLIIFLIVILILFKFIFGLEKDRHRYTKDALFEIFIILAIAFIAYYLSGLLVGFAKISNYFTAYGINTFLIPNFLSIILKEILRYNMLKKSEGLKLLKITTTILFITLDLMNFLTFTTFKTIYSSFIFVALHLIPAICNNIVATYISSNLGYKQNLMWLLVIKMYYYILPIVPNYNDYILSIIRIVFPLIIGYRIFNFFEKDTIRKKDVNEKNNSYLYTIPTIILVAVLVYFSSGYFRYQTFAIGSGSMLPVIKVGDVVIVDKKSKASVGDVVAYNYNNVVVVHRIVDIQKVDNEFYYYSKGDANESKDNYVIYENMIIGVVDLTLPYIGTPAVWLSRL